MTRKAPRAAAALLDLLGPQHEALAGDLLEGYRSGRSKAWYWREALTAIVVASFEDIRAHKVLAARSVVVGWSALLLFFLVAGDFLSRQILGGWVLDQLIVAFGSHPFVMLWATTLRFLPAGCIGFLISGWLVGRLHSSHPAAMLTAFSGSVVTLFAFSSEIVALIGGPRAIPYPLRSVFFMELSFFWHAGFMAVPAFILLGGWWGSSTSPVARVAERL